MSLRPEEVDDSQISHSSLLKIFSSRNLEELKAGIGEPDDETYLNMLRMSVVIAGRQKGFLERKALQIVSDQTFLTSVLDNNPNIERLKTLLKLELDKRVVKDMNSVYNYVTIDELKNEIKEYTDRIKNISIDLEEKLNETQNELIDKRVELDVMKQERDSVINELEKLNIEKDETIKKLKQDYKLTKTNNSSSRPTYNPEFNNVRYNHKELVFAKEQIVGDIMKVFTENLQNDNVTGDNILDDSEYIIQLVNLLNYRGSMLEPIKRIIELGFQICLSKPGMTKYRKIEELKERIRNEM